MAEIQRALIYRIGGTPLALFNFTSSENEVQDILLPGLFSAVNSVSQELFEESSNKLVIDNGNDKITMVRIKNIVIAILSRNSVVQLEPELVRLLNLFESDYNIE